MASAFCTSKIVNALRTVVLREGRGPLLRFCFAKDFASLEEACRRLRHVGRASARPVAAG
ncbi:MAG TPA: hypothetical protein VF266_09840 [Thermoanaerobaculia bacterium]